MADWVSAIAAVISILGAGFAWWKEHLSRAAKAAAVEAEQLTREHEERSKKYLEAIKAIAESLEKPPLEIWQTTGRLFHLRNASKEPITIESVLNREKFVRLDDLDTPLTLDPGQIREFFAMGAFGFPLPPSLDLEIQGRDQALYVPVETRQ